MDLDNLSAINTALCLLSDKSIDNQLGIQVATELSQWNPDSCPVLIIHLNTLEQDRILTQIRQSQYYLNAVFVINTSPLSDCLSDGLWSEHATHCDLITQRIDLLPHFDNCPFESLDLTAKVARYLWVRPDKEIQARWVLDLNKTYDYPLLSCFKDNFQVENLKPLEQTSIVTKGALINRIKRCSHCYSSQLNFVDCCPQCQSIDIQLQESLHCFTCGKVAKEEMFIQHIGLACPKCYSQLKHIGVDYDRPLERFHCNQCQAVFLEGIVQCHCYACSKSQSPNQLLDTAIYALERGHNLRLAAFSLDWRKEERLVLGDFISFAHFVWLLQRQQKLDKNLTENQEATIQRSRVCSIKISSLNPYSDVERLHLAIGQRVLSLLNELDTACQFTETHLLIFFSDSSAEQQQSFNLAIEGLSRLEGTESITLQVSYHTLSNTEDLAQWLMSLPEKSE